MNWQAIGAIGEIGGFVAVLVTLGFLYGQVRQLTRQGALSFIDSSH